MPSYLRIDAELIRGFLPSELAEADDRVFLLYAVLLRAKGAAVTAADVHDAWAAFVELQGAEHADAVPYEQLPSEVQEKDAPFVAAIRRAAATR